MSTAELVTLWVVVLAGTLLLNARARRRPGPDASTWESVNYDAVHHGPVLLWGIATGVTWAERGAWWTLAGGVFLVLGMVAALLAQYGLRRLAGEARP